MREWRRATLGEICKVDWGNTSLTKAAYVEDGEFLAVSAAGCDGKIGHCEHKTGTPVLSAIGARCGTMFFPESDFTAIKNTITLTPIDDIVDGKFLYYLLCSIELPKRGAAQPFMAKGDVQDFAVSLPELSEQKRIVEILDEAFDGIAKATANAQRNLANAQELFDTFLDTIFVDLALTHKKTPLTEVTELITKGSSPKWQGINYVDKPGVLFVTSENVLRNQLSLEKRKYVEECFNQKDAKSILKRNDVLTNIVGASIGRTALYESDEIANVNQAVCVIRCDADKINPRYLCLLLNSPYFTKILHENEVDNARANLSLGFFRSLPVPLPPLALQDEMIIKASEIEANTLRLTRQYCSKIDVLNELKQSLLHKAFMGQLTGKEDIAA